ncbi:MAG: hypothetical protein SO360_01870 [Bifidobacterium tsurumiense]|uniref:hypothetical protein n=1 Tax=Bifidobacterium tsurumiense TaxID=356829 RepID=UPI002A83AA84|nr:hypothetical protein [Bifidobacterium tsurumiense]MDY4677600.1 hypothetical protein [Bifidobacterium tsurumiense]
MTDCPRCQTPITADNATMICRNCRKDYAKTIHSLKENLQLLHQLSLREWKTGQRQGGTTSEPPAPVDLDAVDLLALAQDELQEVAATIGVYGDWRHIMRRLPARLADLARRQDAADSLARLENVNRRLDMRINPRRHEPFIGVCPDCGYPLEASADALTVDCHRCRSVHMVQPIREETRMMWESRYTTQTPASLCEWVRDQVGVKVTRKQVTDWLRRGKLPNATRVGDGWWRFQVSEVMALLGKE